MAGTRISRFPSLAGLLGGAASIAAAAPAGGADDDNTKTLDVGALEAAMAKDVDDATAAATLAATTAANTRWNAVITSDAGKRNPAAAARLLNTTPQSSDDVIATLDDLSPATGGTGARGNAGVDKTKLQGASEQGGNRDAAPDTGGAGSNRNADGTLAAKEHRQKTAEARNARTIAAAGGTQNVRGGGA